MFEASLKDIDAGGFGLDTHYACMPTGMPRQMSGVSRMEFLFSPAVTHIVFEDMTLSPRRIYTDGRDWPKNPQEPTFVGYSVGKWLDTDGDGRYDTLEIETRNVRGPRTWDQTGLPMAPDNEAVFKERIFLDKSNPGILHDEITTTDTADAAVDRDEELQARAEKRHLGRKTTASKAIPTSPSTSRSISSRRTGI